MSAPVLGPLERVRHPKTEPEEQDRFGDLAAALQVLPAVGSGSDVAAAVAYLGSEEAAWLTGAVITVDGGYSLGRRD